MNSGSFFLYIKKKKSRVWAGFKTGLILDFFPMVYEEVIYVSIAVFLGMPVGYF